MHTLFTEKINSTTVFGAVSDDNLKLFITIDRGDDRSNITVEQLLRLVGTHVASRKIERAVIHDIVSKIRGGERLIEDRRVAVGRAPKPGENGRFVLKAKVLEGNGIVKGNPDGVTNLADLHLFDNVEKGSVVAKIYPPSAGISGEDVFGKELEAPPGQAAAPALDNTLSLLTVKEDGEELQHVIAEADGYLALHRGTYGISSDLFVLDDLDFRYGNVDFVGAVQVLGDVMPGFSIRARGGIHVRGSVRGGSLISSKGSITVRNFVYGGSGSMIIAGKDFRARVVQEVNTEVLGDIIIEREASNSILRTAKCLLMPDAVLVGGEVFSVGGVEAHTLGAEIGTPTKINLASEAEASLAYAKIQVHKEILEKELAQLRLKLGPFVEHPEEIEKLEAAMRERISPLLQEYEKVKIKLESLERQRLQLVTKAKSAPVVRVNFFRRLYPGVVLQASGAKFQTDEVLEGPASIEFNLKTKKFRLGKLSDLAN